MKKYMDEMMSNMDILEDIKAEITRYRNKWGLDICTDVSIDGNIATYKVMPEDITGYTIQISLVDGRRRNCGNGKGCFWSEWE